jgi:hypothetical protein
MAVNSDSAQIQLGEELNVTVSKHDAGRFSLAASLEWKEKPRRSTAYDMQLFFYILIMVIRACDFSQ